MPDSVDDKDTAPPSAPAPPATNLPAVRVGRPRTCDRAAVMAAVCERIASGELVEAAAKAEGTTAKSVRAWASEDEELGAIYARARESQAHALAEAIIPLSDAAAEKPTPEGVQAARLQVESRKWLASKVAPKSYGDKYTIEGGPEPIIFRLVKE